MPAGMDAPRAHFAIAGQPLRSWAYALRIWIAMTMALYAAFWLQLDSAASSAVTVAILAQPRRGQALQKALFRIGATLIGFFASLLFTGLFAQSRDLLVVTCALWLAGCVYVANRYDGNRAYGAVLSGYTVAIVTVAQIDAPQQVFDVGIERIAAVVIGIVSVAVVNDALIAPEVYSDVQRALRSAWIGVEAAVEALAEAREYRPERYLAVMEAVVALRLDVLALPTEQFDGGRRSSAARSAMVAMVAALWSACAVSLMLGMETGQGQDDAETRFDQGAASAAVIDQAPLHAVRRSIAVDHHRGNAFEELELARREIANMEGGRRAERVLRLPIHRATEEALRKAFSVFIAIIFAAIVFIYGGWPATSFALSQLGVFAALGSTAPSARSFSLGALIAVPLAVAAAGITEFLVLAGVDSFPLLAIGLAPAVFSACLLSLSRKTGVVGFLMLVYFPVVLAPTNPANYNPQAYINTGSLLVVSVAALAVVLNCFMPTSDEDRRRWMDGRLRCAVAKAAVNRAPRESSDSVWLAADCIVQAGAFAIGGDEAQLGLRRTLLRVQTALAIRSAHASLDSLDHETVDAARRELAEMRPGPIADAASTLAANAATAPGTERPAVIRAVAALSFVADILETLATHRGTTTA